MGQTCTRGGSSGVADNRRSRHYKDKKGDDDAPSASNTTSTPTPKNDSEKPAPRTGSGPSVVTSIEALQHTMRPAVPVVGAELIRSDFRQFTPMFAKGKAALAVVSCERAGHERQVLATGEDRSIALLNYETGHVMRRWAHAHEGDVNCITNPTANGLFATGSRDKVVKVWNFDGDNNVAELRGHTLNVSAVDMDPNGSWVVSGSKDNTVRLWDVERNEELFCGDVGLNIVHFVRHIPALNCVAQGGEDLGIRLWDLRTRGGQSDMELSRTIEGMDYYATCGEVVEGRPHVLLTGHNGVNGCGSYISEWDLRMGKRLCVYSGHTATVTDVKQGSSTMYGPGTVFSASDDGTMGVWNLPDEVPQDEVKITIENRFAVPEGRVTSVACESNGDTIVALDSGCLAVLRPSQGDDGSVSPAMRFRYVGVLQKKE